MIYYVDAMAGVDTYSGTAQTEAWAHAPGDARAAGIPASIVLKPGDRVQFTGAPYRGSISLKFNGAPGAPITYAGGLIDGSDPVLTAAPCASAAACGWAADWRNLTRVTFAPRSGPVDLFDEKGQLFEATTPALPDPFRLNDIYSWKITKKADASTIEAGNIIDYDLWPAASSFGARIGFWIRGNLVTYRSVTGLGSDGSIEYEHSGLDLYNDRDGRIIAIGGVENMRPGLFARIAPDAALVWTRPGGGMISIGSNRTGIDMAGHSHVRVEDFSFRNMSGRKLPEGMAIWNSRYFVSKDWQVSGGNYGPAALHHGGGIIWPNNIDGARIEGVEIRFIQDGSGLRVTSHGSNIDVLNNSVENVGRTAIYFAGVNGGKISGNVIAGAKGVHGNGISLYLGNRNVMVDGNVVTDSPRPVTFEGDGSGALNNIAFTGNVLSGDADSEYAITDWGGKANGVTISGNRLMGGRKAAARLHWQTSGLTFTDNCASTFLVAGGPQPPDWTIRKGC